MKNIVLFLALSSILSIVACKTKPPVPPENDRASAVTSMVVSKALFGGDASIAHVIYFIKVDNSRQMLGHKIISSTYKNGDNVYLLNAKPGKYAIVGYYTMVRNNNNATYHYYHIFDEASIKKTIFTVKENETKIIGQMRIHKKSTFANGDRAQNHYGEILAPGASGWSGLGKSMMTALFGVATIRFPVNLKSLDNSAEVQAIFIKNMQEDWEDTTWQGRESRSGD